MRTSYSALDTFKQCPQKFKFSVIDKIKAPKSPEAAFGSVVHAALKLMFSRDPVFPTLEEVWAYFDENWKISAVKLPNFGENLAELYKKSGREILKNFYRTNPPWNFSVVDTESRFELPLADGDGKTHVLAGIIDRIDKIGDGEYEIIDYKTNRRLPSQESVNENLQMSIYHIALKRRWPDTNPAKIKLSLYFLKHNEKLSAQKTGADIEATKEAVLKTIRDIETKIAKADFPPMPSKLCDYCAYKQICPAWKHLYKKEEQDFDEAKLQETLKEYFEIKSVASKNEDRLAELQGIIKSYMEANKLDRVFDERGYYISKKLQQRFKYDFDKIKEILTAAGLEKEWQSILEADDKKLKAILNTLPYPVRQEILNQKILSKEFVVLTSSAKPVKS